MTDAVVEAGAEAIRQGSKSFATAARLLGREAREGAVMLYAWCRHCDDAIDDQRLGFPAGEGGSGKAAAERLAELEAQTRAALGGREPVDPVYAGLREVVRRHAIPERLPLDHLAGFRMDVESRRYETLADTLDYAYGVAGVVGVMMGHVMGVRDPAILDRASDLGIAFQLTNIARDIVPDAADGRVYLPAEWLREAGIPPGEVGAERHRERLARVAARLVEAAEPYYDSALVGVAALPARSAWAIATARGVYRQIGRDVVRLGPRAWDRRVSTSRAAKLRHVSAALLTMLTGRASRAGSIDRTGLFRRPSASWSS